MAKSSAQIVEVNLKTPLWRYKTANGCITISAPAGETITYERANWLLDKAKQELLRDES